MASTGFFKGWSGRIKLVRRYVVLEVEQTIASHRAPALINKAKVGQEPIAYPLPKAPFFDQAKTPCKPKEGEVEIHGGCWVALEKRPPCY